MTDSIELQHMLMEAQREIRVTQFVASAARCQQKGIKYLSKIGARELELDEEEEIEERFNECVIEQRQNGKSRIRARRICEDMIMEEREGSVLSRAEEARRKFLRTGGIPSPDYYGKPAVFTIFQR
jgi:hypothetical protein